MSLFDFSKSIFKMANAVMAAKKDKTGPVLNPAFIRALTELCDTQIDAIQASIDEILEDPIYEENPTPDDDLDPESDRGILEKELITHQALKGIIVGFKNVLAELNQMTISDLVNLIGVTASESKDLNAGLGFILKMMSSGSNLQTFLTELQNAFIQDSETPFKVLMSELGLKTEEQRFLFGQNYDDFKELENLYRDPKDAAILTIIQDWLTPPPAVLAAIEAETAAKTTANVAPKPVKDTYFNRFKNYWWPAKDTAPQAVPTTESTDSNDSFKEDDLYDDEDAQNTSTLWPAQWLPMRLAFLFRLRGLSIFDDLMGIALPSEDTRNIEAFRAMGHFLKQMGEVFQNYSSDLREVAELVSKDEDAEPTSSSSTTEAPAAPAAGTSIFSAEMITLINTLSAENKQIKDITDSLFIQENTIKKLLAVNIRFVSTIFKRFFKPEEEIEDEQSQSDVDQDEPAPQIQKGQNFSSSKEDVLAFIDEEIELIGDAEHGIDDFHYHVNLCLEELIERYSQDANDEEDSQEKEKYLVAVTSLKDIDLTLEDSQKMMQLARETKKASLRNLRREISSVEQGSISRITSINKKVLAFYKDKQKDEISKIDGLGFYYYHFANHAMDLAEQGQSFEDTHHQTLVVDRSYFDLEIQFLFKLLPLLLKYEDLINTVDFSVRSFNDYLKQKNAELIEEDENPEDQRSMFLRFLTACGQKQGFGFATNFVVDYVKSVLLPVLTPLERITVETYLDELNHRLGAHTEKETEETDETLGAQLTHFRNLKQSFEGKQNSELSAVLNAMKKVETYLFKRAETTGTKNIGYSAKDYESRRDSWSRILSAFAEARSKNPVSALKGIRAVIEAERQNFKRWKKINPKNSLKVRWKTFWRNMRNLFRVSTQYSKGLRELSKALRTLETQTDVVDTTKSEDIRFLRKQADALLIMHRPVAGQGGNYSGVFYENTNQLEPEITPNGKTVLKLVSRENLIKTRGFDAAREAGWLHSWGIPDNRVQIKALEERQIFDDYQRRGQLRMKR